MEQEAAGGEAGRSQEVGGTAFRWLAEAAADGGGGNGGQGAGEVAAVEDGAAGGGSGRCRRGRFWLFRQLHKCGGLTATLQ